jgi:predicted ATPase/DNA-binding CsgD family transcriptional regulator
MAPVRPGTGNLPAELTSFVGRRDEMAQVRRLVAESRLVTLSGVGGVGKTRLALRAAAGLARAFSDGVWLVQFDQVRDRALVAQAVAEALGLRERAGNAPAEALAGHVADRRLLVVLDNCEHLVDEVAALADRLLRAAPGLRVLATSRESLNIAGERVLPVGPLAAPDPGQQLTPAEVGLFPAVRLFAERAAEVVPGFAVTEANMASVAGICLRVEGLPLALELAAARLRVLSPQQIDARLSDRLGLLTRGSRTNPGRQQTLRASIDWSYELCSEPERLLWARISVFAGGFELDAVEEICADHWLAAEDLLELLAALVDKSVLIAEHGEGVVRYRLPETLREYGQERLQEAGEYTVMRRWHRDWCEQLARLAYDGWLSPQLATWTARLFKERANVQAAQDFCQNEPGEAEAGLRIAFLAREFYYCNAGYFSEGRYRLSEALARVGETTVWRAQGLLLASFLATLSGDRSAAPPLLAEGTSLARQLNDPDTSSFAAYCAGLLCLSANDLPRAIAHFEDAQAALPATAVHDRQRAVVLAGLSGAAGLAGDEESVVACQKELAALTEAGGESIRRWYSAYCLWALGLVAWRRGDLDRAGELVQQGLRLGGELNDQIGTAHRVEALAWIAASAAQHERAAALLGAAASRWRSMGMTVDSIAPLAGYHRACQCQARHALGEERFQAAYQRGLQLPAEETFASVWQPPPHNPADKPSSGASAAPAPTAARPGIAPLTAREVQVARLVAQGHSNREIAARLVISQRTAEGHVEHILTKLSFISRAQIAAWVVASQPDDDR